MSTNAELSLRGDRSGYWFLTINIDNVEATINIGGAHTKKLEEIGLPFVDDKNKDNTSNIIIRAAEVRLQETLKTLNYSFELHVQLIPGGNTTLLMTEEKSDKLLAMGIEVQYLTKQPKTDI